MARYRLPALALLVTVLLAVVAVAALGRPLAAGPGKGGGLPASFWDYFITSALIIAGLVWLAVLITALHIRPDPRKKPMPPAVRTLRALASMMALALLLLVLGRHLHLHPVHAQKPPQTIPPPRGHLKHPHHPQRPAAASPAVHFRWDELAIVLGLLVLAGVVLASRRTRPEPRRLELSAPEALAAALDDSLDDLRADPDLRRAIVAAYARMEMALAAAGIPRRPPEAPLEYLERALLAFDTQGAAVRRLTDLFEWARFSQHEPDPAMRDEAVDALEAVRDELRRPAPEPVAT